MPRTKRELAGFCLMATYVIGAVVLAILATWIIPNSQFVFLSAIGWLVYGLAIIAFFAFGHQEDKTLPRMSLREFLGILFK